jgi:hypothetical protein
MCRMRSAGTYVHLSDDWFIDQSFDRRCGADELPGWDGHKPSLLHKEH